MPDFTGGTAACVVASRLASADANLRVLLLEAGPTTYNDPAHTVPLNFMSNLTPSSRTVRWHVSKPSTALGSRAAIVPCGQCLGGGGSINSTSRIFYPCAPICGCLIEFNSHPIRVNFILLAGSHGLHAPLCLRL